MRSRRVIVRLLSYLALILMTFILSRALLRALPGDPLETLIAETGTQIPALELRQELKLDQPFWSATASEFKNALQGELGRSILSRQPVSDELSLRLRNSLKLALLTLVIGTSLSLFLGISACAYRSIDLLCTFYGMIAAALPLPWIGPMLAYVFSLKLQLLEISQGIGLPALSLSLGFIGLWSRLIRERVRETLIRGSAQGARARGIPEWKILIKYGFAPASAALCGFFGTYLGHLFAGSFVAEVLFDWPGLGAYFVDAVLQRDYPAVQGALLFTAILALLGNALGDLAQYWLDPKESTSI